MTVLMPASCCRTCRPTPATTPDFSHRAVSRTLLKRVHRHPCHTRCPGDDVDRCLRLDTSNCCVILVLAGPQHSQLCIPAALCVQSMRIPFSMECCAHARKVACGSVQQQDNTYVQLAPELGGLPEPCAATPWLACAAVKLGRLSAARDMPDNATTMLPSSARLTYVQLAPELWGHQSLAQRDLGVLALLRGLLAQVRHHLVVLRALHQLPQCPLPLLCRPVRQQPPAHKHPDTA